jgi:hypothetical protein
MAKFKMELPTELLKEFKNLEQNAEKMMGEMTKAGAEVVKDNIMANVPESFKKSNIMKCLKLTRIYKTPSDEGINTKVAFYGYFINSKGQEVPAPLVANVFEYGNSKRNKQPFMRKSFNKTQITKAMLKVQEKYLPKE